MESLTEAEARLWIINAALGRRNLTEEQQSYLRGRRYEEEKKPARRPTAEEKGGHNDHLKTRDRLAEETGVSEATVKRDAQYARAVDTIEKSAGSGAKQSILDDSGGGGQPLQRDPRTTGGSESSCRIAA